MTAIRSVVVGVALSALLAAPASARESGGADRLVRIAHEYLGVPYRFGGRSRMALDCLGLVFLPWERVYGTPWRSLSVMPTKLAPQLGRRIGQVGRAQFLASTAPTPDAGEVLLFLAAGATSDKPFLRTETGEPLWVWHVALSSGAGRMLHASPWSGKVVEEDIVQFVRKHEGFQGVVRIAPGGHVP